LVLATPISSLPSERARVDVVSDAGALMALDALKKNWSRFLWLRKFVKGRAFFLQYQSLVFLMY
jgi:hypothetical protein